MQTKALPVEWDNAIHGAAKLAADAAGMVELDIEIAWARVLGEIPGPVPAAALTPEEENAHWDEANDAAAAEEARRRARLEKRIRAAFAAEGCTWMNRHFEFARHSVSGRAVLDAETFGILKRHPQHHSTYRLVKP